MKPRSFLVVWALLAGLACAVSAAPLGVSYPCGRGGLKDAAKHLDRIQALGFTMVSFVPNYAYPHLNEVDFSQAPGFDELGQAVEGALRRRLAVVLKPHLEPAMYQPGFDSFKSDNHSWRARTGWRGFFDVDPMTPDYREKLVVESLRMLKDALSRLGGPPAAPIRFELGTELMDSVVYQPERWEALLAAAKRERDRLGLKGQVLLSHNFSHHFEMPEDFVLRMSPSGRKALARYIKGLDAFAISQYMDLTSGVPEEERGRRLPTPREIALALVLHDTHLRDEVMGKLLGLKLAEIPPMHVGEFGVGRGGLRHPNLWEGDASPAEEEALQHEIALGHRGLLVYLGLSEGRMARSAVLWVTGRHFDVFGWMSPEYAVPEAADALAPGWDVGRAIPEKPADFDEFWARTLKELSAVPVDLKLDESAAWSDARVRCAKASYQSLKRIRLHAWYCRPTAKGRHPAILINPWYGRSTVEPPQDLARRGFAALAYQGRGFEVDQPSYPLENSWYILSGIEDKETYVYREMFAHAVRGVDALASRPEVDVRRIGVAGMSQGGGLSLAVAALDQRVAAVSADFPFLCDFKTSLRTALSPFKDIRGLMEDEPAKRAAVARTVAYFDILNFAARIKAPVKVQVGLRDRTCPPQGIKNVYERIGSPKVLEEFPQADHMDLNAWRWDKMIDSIAKTLGK